MAFATSCVSWYVCMSEWANEYVNAYVGVYAVYAIIVVIVCLQFRTHVCFHRIVHNYYSYRHCCCRSRYRHRYVRSFTSFHEAFIIHRLNLQTFTFTYYYYILIAFLHMSISLFGLFFGYSLFEWSFLCVFFFLYSDMPHLHSSFSPLHEYTITNLHVNKSMRCVYVLICQVIYLFILGILVV